MINLTHNLFAIKVPSEYKQFKISGTNYICGSHTNASEKGMDWEPIPPRLESSDFTIIGTISKDNRFDFHRDCPEATCDLYAVNWDWHDNGNGHTYPKHINHYRARFGFLIRLEKLGIDITTLTDEKLLILKKNEK